MIRHAVLTTVAVGALSLAVLGQPVQAQDKPATQELADLRASAEAGEAQAQYNLGVRYTVGEGVPQDYVEAVAWYRRAAEQGHAAAQFNLGGRYGTGEGVPQDYVEAHMWLNLAASRSSGEQRERVVTARDAVAERMTPADLSEAQRLAREWYAAHPVP